MPSSARTVLRPRTFLPCRHPAAAAGPLLVFAVLLSAAACTSSPAPDRPQVDSTNTRAKDLVRVMQEEERVSQFVRAVEAVGLAEELRGVGPFTVFAPTDDAFRRSGLRIDTLFAEEDRDSLRKVVSHHLVRGSWTVSRVQDSLRVNTLLDRSIKLERGAEEGILRVERRPILSTIPAQNGVVHILGGVLHIPQPDTTDVPADSVDVADAA